MIRAGDIRYVSINGALGNVYVVLDNSEYGLWRLVRLDGPAQGLITTWMDSQVECDELIVRGEP